MSGTGRFRAHEAAIALASVGWDDRGSKESSEPIGSKSRITSEASASARFERKRAHLESVECRWRLRIGLTDCAQKKSYSRVLINQQRRESKPPVVMLSCSDEDERALCKTSAVFSATRTAVIGPESSISDCRSSGGHRMR
jgi:hypothetical protein